MEQVSVIARRLKDGQVQYGWSSGDKEEIGRRLLKHYRLPERIEYLFALGKVRSCASEKEIFHARKDAENAFFYETDGCWYYVFRGPFQIKAPLALLFYGIDKKGYGISDSRDMMEKGLIEYMLWEYLARDEIFEALVRENCGDVNKLAERIFCRDRPMLTLYEIKWLYHYFDNWAVVFADERCEKIVGYSLTPVKRRRRETVRR